MMVCSLKLKCNFQIKLLSKNKLIICALGNLHYQISREKFEPEPEVRIPVQVQIFLLRSDTENETYITFPHNHSLHLDICHICPQAFEFLCHTWLLAVY